MLKDAGATALSFADTLERTPPTVRQAAETVESMRTTLLTIQSQLGAFEILGSRPLGNVSDQFGQIASQMSGLDARLELIATDLEDNSDKLLANAAVADGARRAARRRSPRTWHPGSSRTPSTTSRILLLVTVFVLVAVDGRARGRGAAVRAVAAARRWGRRPSSSAAPAGGRSARRGSRSCRGRRRRAGSMTSPGTAPAPAWYGSRPTVGRKSSWRMSLTRRR